ncbi:MAG TPA: hypothetical protein EYG19_05255, partial [Verrucomicrobia bacterium]|nr:hypothetical protein [Verrucomicrobiota bacterium]
MWTGWPCPLNLKTVMKNTARTLLATLATFTITVNFLHAQEGPVTIPGLEGGGEGTDPGVNEVSGTGVRATLRQPYGGGVILPPWMQEIPPPLPGIASNGHEGTELASVGVTTGLVPEFIPGYRRLNTLTGEVYGEFQTSIEEGTGGFGEGGSNEGGMSGYGEGGMEGFGEGMGEGGGMEGFGGEGEGMEGFGEGMGGGEEGMEGFEEGGMEGFGEGMEGFEEGGMEGFEEGGMEGFGEGMEGFEEGGMEG